VAQTASASGFVDGAKSTANDEAGTRLNTLDNSVFESAEGVITVQQNNGNNNAMGSAISGALNGISFGLNP
jgi:hypothetical protein